MRYIEAHVTKKHFADKTFADCHKNAEFAKVFSLESFRLYGIHPIRIYNSVLQARYLLKES